jgi:hypothetical protein
MTQLIPTKQDSGAAKFQLKPMDAPEVIRALTPIIIALIGGAIGIVVLLQKPVDTAALGLASTAIAGAAGLAQPQKEQKEENK